ncbi:MAG: multidrug effflux MFS transporter [Pseudomonadota bacterium]
MTSDRAVRFLDRNTPPHIVTLVLMAGLGAMNMSAFLPALPQMTTFFGTEYAIMQLSVSLYLAAIAVLQLLIGQLSDRFGRRPVVLWCLVIYMVATLGCILAPNVELFLAFRIGQSAVAAGLVLSRAIVRDLVDEAHSASMIGYVTMGMALVPMIAPMIGGALSASIGWQAVFWFLLAGGVLVWAVCFYDQGETALGEGRRFRDQVREYPELLQSVRFWGYVFTAAFTSGAFFAFLGGAPLVASDVYGLSSFWAGVGFGAPAIGYAIGNGISGKYSVQVGINRMIIVGATLTVIGLTLAALLVLAGFDSAILFFGFCTFVGLGNGMVIPNANAGMLSVRPHLAGTASGLGGTFMLGGGAALSVFASVVLAWGTTSLPLLALMASVSALGLASIVGVLERERRLKLT